MGYKYINNQDNTAVRYERFTQSADYGEEEGAVKFMFSTAIIPMLVELEKRFTSYEIEQVAELSSSYAMRLYEFFMQHLDKKTGKGWFKVSLDDLRFRFGLLPTEYSLMSDFKKRLLDYAIKQINNNTELKVNYEQHKQGRKIVGLTFTIQLPMTQTKQKPFKLKNANTPDIFDNLTVTEQNQIKQ